MGRSCAFDCDACPAAARCGRQPNFCWRGRCQSCEEGERDPLLRLEVREAVIRHLGGLDLTWPEGLAHPALPDLPLHLPVLVQAYHDEIDLPWVAIHGRRLLGETGERLTPKHRRVLREVYRLGARTRVALEFYVDDRVLEGIWRARGQLLEELHGLGADLVLTPSFSVWRDAARSIVTWNEGEGAASACKRLRMLDLASSICVGRRPGLGSENCASRVQEFDSAWHLDGVIAQEQREPFLDLVFDQMTSRVNEAHARDTFAMHTTAEAQKAWPAPTAEICPWTAALRFATTAAGTAISLPRSVRLLTHTNDPLPGAPFGVLELHGQHRPTAFDPLLEEPDGFAPGLERVAATICRGARPRPRRSGARRPRKVGDYRVARCIHRHDPPGRAPVWGVPAGQTPLSSQLTAHCRQGVGQVTR